MGVRRAFGRSEPLHPAKNGNDYNKAAYPALIQEDLCLKA